MKNEYNRIVAAFCSVALLSLMASCYSSLSYNDAVQKNIRRADNPDMHDDARFIADAASYNLLATALAEEATQKGYSASLVSLAKQNLELHEEMTKKLKRLARKEKMVLPAEMKDDHQRLLAELKDADRRDFDRTYVRIMQDISSDDRDMFSRMATEAKSEEIRGFAATQLGLFDTHKTQLETVDAELLKTY